MKSPTLDAGQRLTVLDIIGQQQGNLATLTPLWRVAELLRIGEAEAGELKLHTENSPGGVTFLWDPAQQPKEFSLEDADALALERCLRSFEGLKPPLVPVLNKILEALR